MITVCNVSVASTIHLEKLPEEILTEIFFTVLQTAGIQSLHKDFTNLRLVNRHFCAISAKPHILKKFLEKVDSVRQLSLSLIRKLPLEAANLSVIQKIFEKKLFRASNQEAFLKQLLRDELLLIKNLDCSLNFSTETKTEFFFEKLENLEVVGFFNSAHFNDHTVKMLEKYSKNLKELAFHFFFPENATNLIDQHSEIAKRVTSIFFDSCGNLTDAKFHHLLTKFPGIQELRIYGQHQLTLNCFRTLKKITPNLTNISLVGNLFYDKHVEVVVNDFPNLHSLNISMSSTQDCFSKILLERSQQLKKLNLTGLPVKDIHFERVSTKEDSLEELHLRECKYLNDNALAIIADRYRKLKVVDVQYCQQITVAGVHQLMADLPQTKIITTLTV